MKREDAIEHILITERTTQMDRQKNVIITHSADLDGFVSAAFMMDILDAAGVLYELRFADYPNLAQAMEQAAREIGKSIWLPDSFIQTGLKRIGTDN